MGGGGESGRQLLINPSLAAKKRFSEQKFKTQHRKAKVAAQSESIFLSTTQILIKGNLAGSGPN